MVALSLTDTRAQMSVLSLNVYITHDQRVLTLLSSNPANVIYTFQKEYEKNMIIILLLFRTESHLF